MKIKNNINSLDAQRNRRINASKASKSMGKLSSGLRINTAADDAAGLAISEKMRGQIRGLDQALRNTQDGISLVQTAEGALSETTSILQRMRELAVRSANDTNIDNDRLKIQSEVDKLAEEITRISNTTEFNEHKLLNGEISSENKGELKIQIGANSEQTLSLDINAMDAKSLGVARVVRTAIIEENSNNAGVSSVSINSSDISKSVVEGTYQVKLSQLASGTTGATHSMLSAQLKTAESGKIVTTFDAGLTEIKPNATVAGSATADTNVTLKYHAASTLFSDQTDTMDNDTYDGSGAMTIDGIYEGTGTMLTATYHYGYPSSQAGGTFWGDCSGGLTISAKSGGAYDGTAGEGISVIINAASGAIEDAVFSSSTRKLTITLNADGTRNAAAINNILASKGLDNEFVAGGFPGASVSSYGGTAQCILTGGYNAPDTIIFDDGAGAGAVITEPAASDKITFAGITIDVAEIFANAGLSNDGQTFKKSLAANITDAWIASGDLSGIVSATNNTVNGLTIDVDNIVGETDGKTVTISANGSGKDIGEPVIIDSQNGGSYVLGDANGAGQVEVSFGAGSAREGTSTINVTANEETVEGGIDVTTQVKADVAITIIQNAIETVSSERSKLGAYQNRLEHIIKNLETSDENLTSAESRIRDVDMAQEMSEYSKNNILDQVAQSMIAQANQQPQQVLSLLQNT